MITIWGRRNSSNVMPVMWTVGELGLPHERKDVGGSFGGLDTDAFAKMNPNRQIPVLQEGSFILWESNAIVRHLARVHGVGGLQPETEADLAHAEQWMDWQRNVFAAQIGDLFMGTVRTEPGKRNPAQIAAGAEALGRSLKILDDHLASRQVMVGDRLTIADIPIGTLLFRYFNMPIDRPALPNVEAYYARLQQRQAYKTHILIPFGRNPAEWYMLERGISI